MCVCLCVYSFRALFRQFLLILYYKQMYYYFVTLTLRHIVKIWWYMPSNAYLSSLLWQWSSALLSKVADSQQLLSDILFLHTAIYINLVCIVAAWKNRNTWIFGKSDVTRDSAISPHMHLGFALGCGEIAETRVTPLWPQSQYQFL